MKTRFFVFLAILSCFVISCGGSGDSSSSSSDVCTSNADCQLGKVCKAGRCVAPGSSEDGSGEEGSGGEGSGGEGGSGGGGSEGGGSGTSDGDSQSDDSDPSGGSTAGCNPGKTEKCTYQGPEGTEGVGPCKAGERTCGAWATR